jgi:acyl-CoA synthetase (AMP-forming)/AMP-acid ligase II/acyl carrier protein
MDYAIEKLGKSIAYLLAPPEKIVLRKDTHLEDQPERANSIARLLLQRSLTNPEAVAILAPDRQPVTYARLWAQIEQVARVFRQWGIGPNDRIAVVLPDGTEMAAAFLAISASATFAPLNPAYRAEEFDFFLSDLQAKALVVPAGQHSPACPIARTRGIPVFELSAREGGAAGLFELTCENQDPPPASAQLGFAVPEDGALVLHTSGTTSRPKIVPLTHSNLCSSARHIAATLALTPADRCLCVMPLFHIHGLMGAILSSITAGASVVCTPGFIGQRFFEWLDDFQPTWYTAVPTMHQAVVAHAAEHAAIIQRRPLRLIRSSSSALPPTVMRAMEQIFGAPVIESYGMTEASHQMASNPLPPASRKPGSVGVAAGPQIAIMDDAGNLLEGGQTGEIVIRGPNVTLGYENNPQANSTAFTNGWFRTGDQGYLDAEGYLFITGRIKELINRGGEKIAPREIDEVLMNHPGVRQAVAFAVPHPTLGEDVAVAVVAMDGHAPGETELREFAAQHLANFKVPTRIVLVFEIPKGPTGKLQRIGLADRLAKELAVDYEVPAEGIEHLAATLFEELLQCRRVGRNDNFFALGGDSLRATRVHVRLAEALGVEIRPTLLFRYPTVALVAAELARLQEEQEIEFLAAQLEKLPPAEAALLLEEKSGGKR